MRNRLNKEWRSEKGQTLVYEGFTGRLYLLERQRQRIENQQDLRAQQFTVVSHKATITWSEKKIAQIPSGYRQQLQNECVDMAAQLHKLEQDSEKQQHRNKKHQEAESIIAVADF